MVLREGVAIVPGTSNISRSMSCLRWILLALLGGLFAVDVSAQEDPSKEFFAAYQEFQRGERLEREGRTADAVAKFRYVATQLSQIRSQNPDWQPLVVDFRLKRTQEAIVRLEGSLDSQTLGPPPDLPLMTGSEDDVLPPIAPPRREPGTAVPTISISPGGADETLPDTSVAMTATEPAAPAGSADTGRMQIMLDAEREKIRELESKLQRGEAELTSVSMELEKTRAERVDLAAQLKALQDAGSVPAELEQGVKEEVDRLTKVAAELEEALKTAATDKEELNTKLSENSAQVEELKTQLEAAQGEAETAKTRVTELEGERTQLVAARDEAQSAAESAKEEVKLLALRVTELEEERTQLVAARDEAQLQAQEAKTALEKSADLIEANRQLEEKLASAAQQISGMEDDAAEKEKVIASLQGDLDKVRTELASAQTRLKDDRERFDQLQLVNNQLLKEYDEVTGALAAVQLGDVTAAEAKLLQSENEVLRGIIMRSMKEQARREQAFRLAQDEMQRLEIKSDTLNDRINDLAKPTLELTAQEQQMFKTPTVTLLDSDAARVSASVEVLKPQVDSTATAVSEPAPTPDDSVTAEATPAVSPVIETPIDVAAEEQTVAASEGEAEVAEQTNEVVETEQTSTSASSPPVAEVLPEAVQQLLAAARDEFIKGNFSGAERLYQEFIDLYPDNVVALANLGVAQFRQGKLTAAQLALEKAVKAAPEDSFTLTTLGAVMIEQGRVEEALGYLERSNQVKPDDAITLNYMGVAASQLNQFGKAEQSLRSAIKAKPDYAEAHFNLAVIYATAKPPSIALAKRHYEKALELGASPDKRLSGLIQGEPGS